MNKLIKNYSTEVPIERTIAEIQKLLASNGATGIAQEFDSNGTLRDLFFKINHQGRTLAFRLPAKASQVYDALHANATADYHTRYGKQWRQNAERVAWRICKTWLESQLTLINLDQAKIEEVFLPYLVMPNNKTLFQIMQERQFLLPGGEEPQPAG